MYNHGVERLSVVEGRNEWPFRGRHKYRILSSEFRVPSTEYQVPSNGVSSQGRAREVSNIRSFSKGKPAQREVDSHHSGTPRTTLPSNWLPTSGRLASLLAVQARSTGRLEHCARVSVPLNIHRTMSRATTCLEHVTWNIALGLCSAEHCARDVALGHSAQAGSIVTYDAYIHGPSSVVIDHAHMIYPCIHLQFQSDLQC